MHNSDWQDLRYILSLAQEGSVRGAADALAVDRTTVLRRIKRFENRLNCELFQRRGSRYVLTLEAEQLLGAARDFEKIVTELERRVAGREVRLEGEIRVTTTDALLASTVTPHLASFSKKHPDIIVEVALTNHRLNLTRREADVAIRPIGAPPLPLVGRRLSQIDFGIYASEEYLRQSSALPLTAHRWLGIDEPLAGTPVAEWLRQNVPNERIVFKAGSFVALRLAAECSLGLCVLPRRLAEQSNLLKSFGPALDSVTSELWIVTHAEMAHTARIRAFVDHFVEAFRETEG